MPRLQADGSVKILQGGIQVARGKIHPAALAVHLRVARVQPDCHAQVFNGNFQFPLAAAGNPALEERPGMFPVQPDDFVKLPDGGIQVAGFQRFHAPFIEIFAFLVAQLNLLRKSSLCNVPHRISFPY